MVMSRKAYLLILLSVLASSPCAAKTVLLDFSSASCLPCRRMRPTVDRIKRAGYEVQEISIDRQPQVAARYGVTRVPTFIVVSDQKVKSRLTGTTSFEQLKEMLDRANARVIPAQAHGNAPVVPLSPSASALSPNQDLTQPQPGRVLAIQDPNPHPQQQLQATGNPFPQPAPRQTVAQPGSGATPSGVDERRLIEATVKISVKDPDGTSAGTGTLVDAREGEALVLTCGHLFRTSEGKGQITVTLYQMGQAGAEVRTTLTGSLIHYDLQRDLALVSVRPDVSISPIAIGSPQVQFTAGESVVSIGCNTGHNPTAVSSQITTVDRYQGYSNVEVAGAPIEGRSGGGLFNAQGHLIGVCYAADPQGNEGLYASLPSIHEKLNELKLSMVYQRQAPVVPTAPAQMASPAPTASLASHAEPPQDPFQVRGQNVVSQPQSAIPQAAVSAAPQPVQPEATLASSNLSPAEQATLEEIASRGASSEVICIIRPHSPNGKSEVITLRSASPEFVQALVQQRQSTTASSAETATASVGGTYR